MDKKKPREIQGQRALTGTGRGLSDKMDALKIKGDKHNVVYMGGRGGAGLQTGHGFKGVAGGVVSRVKPMSSDMSFKQQEKKK